MMKPSPIFLAVAGALAIFSVAKAESLPELIAEGDALDARMKTVEALAVYLRAEKLAPEDPTLLIKIAKQYGESMVDQKDDAGRRLAGEKALGYARRALEKAPDFADAHLAVAICHGRLLNYLPAREKVESSRQVKIHAEKAVSLDPGSDYAWHMLGRWHRAVADTGALLKGIVKIVYGGLPSASHENAVKAFEKAAALEPDRMVHHVELGLTYAAMNEKDKAKGALKRGISLPIRERDDRETMARGKAALESL